MECTLKSPCVQPIEFSYMYHECIQCISNVRSQRFSFLLVVMCNGILQDSFVDVLICFVYLCLMVCLSVCIFPSCDTLDLLPGCSFQSRSGVDAEGGRFPKRTAPRKRTPLEQKTQFLWNGASTGHNIESKLVNMRTQK